MQFSKHNFKSFTVTIASPGVFTSAEHELYEGDQIILETSDTLPTGLTADTVVYYVIRNGLTSSTFQVSLTDYSHSAVTDTRTAVVTTATQSGTHKYLKVNRGRLTINPQNDR